ncbi:MAG: ANTAR domain-containing protein [Vallitaleaceae bacterium]|nr:ANTAR domain-containing protein [Vallitaleaceae bacterium]
MDIRVILGSSNTKILKQLASFLTENGILVLDATNDGYDLLRKVHTLYPDLVIVDDHLKGMLGHEISETLIDERVCPIIALIRPSDTGNYVNLNQEPIFASIVKPCGKEILIHTMQLLVKSSKSIIALQNEVVQIKEKKDVQNTVDYAKRLLMENMNLTEEEAHRRIQKQSMDRGVAKIKIAETIIKMYGTR